MGVEQFQYDDEDPSHADAGRTADAGRPGDQAPPGSAETHVEPAEPRTRQQYADHVHPQGVDPPSDRIPNPGPDSDREESRHSEGNHPETTSLDEEQSIGSSAEEQQKQDQPRVPNDSGGSHEEPPSPDDSPAEPANPEDVHNGTTGDEGLDASKPTGAFNSATEGRKNARGYKEDEELGEPLHHEDAVPDDYGNPELLEDAASEDEASSPAQNDDLPGSNRDARQIADKPHPLTDQEWAEHLDEVQDGLEKGRDAGLRTNHLYTIDGKGQIWTKERELLHDSIIEDFYARAANVPCDFKAIMAGGLSGAGKTTVLTERTGIDLAQYLMINPDDFKEEMARRGMLPEIEGLSPMEASDLAHEESSHLAKRLARRAEAAGKNLIWDITMSSQDSTVDRIRNLREAGYAHLEGVFVDIPIEMSVKRTDSRHREDHENYRYGIGLGGRFVPPEVIKDKSDSEWSSKNRRTFETVKSNLSTWTIYDNSIEDRPAVLIDSSSTRYEQRRKSQGTE